MGVENEAAEFQGFVISIDDQHGKFGMMRPACFVFDTPRGFVWIEPSFYSEPGSTSAPAMHEFSGEITDHSRGSWRLRGNFSGWLMYYEPEDDGLLGDCMRWWLNEYIPRSGKTYEQLRDEMKQRLLRSGVLGTRDD